jgi:hypothetical protein
VAPIDRPVERASRSLFEYLSAHENADEQQQHDDDEDELDH